MLKAKEAKKKKLKKIALESVSIPRDSYVWSHNKDVIIQWIKRFSSSFFGTFRNIKEIRQQNVHINFKAIKFAALCYFITCWGKVCARDRKRECKEQIIHISTSLKFN